MTTEDPHKNQNYVGLIAVALMLGSGYFHCDVWAHTITQTRVIHILVSKQNIECYINFLLPSSAKSDLWIRMFDHNRNLRLEPAEQLALGKFLATRYLSRLSVHLNGHLYPVQLKEVVNSQLRGNPHKHSYSWDYRWSVWRPKLTAPSQKLSITVPLMFEQEMIPVALVPLAGQKLQRTSTSYLLTKNNQSRALCRIDEKQPSCSFIWQSQGEKRKQNTRQSSRTESPTPQPR